MDQEQFSTVHADLEINDGDWQKYIDRDKGLVEGQISRIGVLPNATKRGNPGLMILAYTADGTPIFVQTTWRAFSLAILGLIARWGTP